MIDVHYWPTPNGWKISIMLEETGLPYKVMPMDAEAADERPLVSHASPQKD